MGWKLDESTLDALIDLERFEAAVRRGEYPGGLIHLAYIAISYAALRKLGFDSTETSIRALILESIPGIIEYHTGDWWNEEMIKRTCKRRGFDDIKTATEVGFYAQYAPACRDTLVLDRETLASSVLACLLADEVSELKSVSGFYSPAMQPNYYGDRIDERYQRLLLLIAAHVGNQDITQYEHAIVGISERPLKVSIALENLVRAVFSSDQSAFDDALPASISIRMRRWEYMAVIDHIALEESILVEVARSRGLTIPTLSKKRRSAILMREDLENWGE